MRVLATIAAALAGLLASSLLEDGSIAPPPGEPLAIELDPIVWIEEGEFTLGATPNDVHHAILLCQEEHDLAVAEGCATARFAHELGVRRVYLRTFGIDRTEVTNAAWRRCMAAGRCVPSRTAADDPRTSGDALPVAGVTLAEAAAYCEYAGGRLPTEEEWEKAARGDSTRRFPWGRHYHARLANHGRPPLRPDATDGFRWAAPVGSFPDGASPYGVLDMAGNVYEWTSTAPSTRDFAALGFETQDPAPYRILRGGSWSHPAVALRVTHRALLLATDARADVGVRCAHDPPPSVE